MKSFLIFAILQLLAFALGASDTLTIALIVVISSASVFAVAYFSAFAKDRLNKRRMTRSALDLG